MKIVDQDRIMGVIVREERKMVRTIIVILKEVRTSIRVINVDKYNRWISIQ
jgi:hypothetical protein